MKKFFFRSNSNLLYWEIFRDRKSNRFFLIALIECNELDEEKKLEKKRMNWGEEEFRSMWFKFIAVRGRKLNLDLRKKHKKNKNRFEDKSGNKQTNEKKIDLFGKLLFFFCLWNVWNENLSLFQTLLLFVRLFVILYSIDPISGRLFSNHFDILRWELKGKNLRTERSFIFEE